jgi:molecular chaperone GrpE (heat shock protein)
VGGQRQYQEDDAAEGDQVAVALQVDSTREGHQHADEAGDPDGGPYGLVGSLLAVEPGDEHVPDAVEERGEGQARKGGRALLREILEVRDRLVAGLEAAEAPAHEAGRWRLFGPRRESGRLEGIVRGISLTLSRLDDLLESRRVRPVEALDRPFDPASMKAVEVVEEPEVPDGWVVREFRRGYRMEGEILRAAEVAVSRKKDKTTREERTGR